MFIMNDMDSLYDELKERIIANKKETDLFD